MTGSKPDRAGLPQKRHRQSPLGRLHRVLSTRSLGSDEQNTREHYRSLRAKEEVGSVATFDELSPYEYGDVWIVRNREGFGYEKRPLPERVLNVGWIDVGREYPTGDVPIGFAEALAQMRFFGCQQTRGFHRCSGHSERGQIAYEIAPDGIRPPERRSLPAPDRDTVYLGSNEWWVPSGDSAYFSAPSLVLHYVLEHAYLPPAEFVDAVFAAKQIVEADATH